MWNSIVSVLAAVGAVLGILNTVWFLFVRERVRLRVRGMGWVNGLGERGFAVEIVNLSVFAVNISQVRIPVDRKKVFVCADLIRDLPKRIEPRAAFTIYMSPGTEEACVPARFQFEVKTACGVFARSQRIRRTE